MLSTPADFPFFSDCTAASTSLQRMGWSSSVSVWGQSSTDGSPLALWLYSSVQYSVHRFSISRSSVRHFSELSWTVVVNLVSQWSSLSQVGMPSYCCSSSDFLQSHYTVLLSSFLLPFHAPLDVVVHFPVFLRSFRFNCLGWISLSVLITAVLKVVIIESRYVSSLSRWW